MNTKRVTIGAQAFFFREGLAYTVPAAGTASRTAKPGAADTGWLNCGVSDWTFQNTGTTEDFKAPAPGARVLWDKIVTSKGLKVKGKLMEMQNLVWQVLLSSETLPASPTAGGQFNPLEGDPIVRGWLQLQLYGQDNVLINTLDLYVAMTIPGDVSFGDKPVDVDVECDVLFSTKNTGNLA